jgi:hypothetical protein
MTSLLNITLQSYEILFNQPRENRTFAYTSSNENKIAIIIFNTAYKKYKLSFVFTISIISNITSIIKNIMLTAKQR